MVTVWAFAGTKLFIIASKLQTIQDKNKKIKKLTPFFVEESYESYMKL